MVDLIRRMAGRLIRVESWPVGFDVPRYQAHRGYRLDGAQENTLPAFRQAKQRGAKMIECDVQLSRDRRPVVFHDEDLRRLFHRPERVADLSVNEVFELANAPLLEDLLKDPDVPRLVNIELKSKEIWRSELEVKVAAVVLGAQAADRVLFSSFNPFSLFWISRLLPQVPRALLVSGAKVQDNNWLLRNLVLAPAISLHALHLEQGLVDEGSMAFWNRREIPVFAWTVNDADLAARMFAWGVRGVISDSCYGSE